MRFARLAFTTLLVTDVVLPLLTLLGGIRLVFSAFWFGSFLLLGPSLVSVGLFLGKL